MNHPAQKETTGPAYDRFARRYADFAPGHYTRHPLERALIPAFTDLAHPHLPLADLGCGPGHVAARLHTQGLRVLGLDLSGQLLTHARNTHPGPAFVRANMASLPLAPTSLGAILAHYSLIHTPPEQVRATFTEWARVLAPGGPVLISFQAQSPTKQSQPFDHAIAPAHRHNPDHLLQAAETAGLAETARLDVAAHHDTQRRWPQTHLLLQRTP